VVTEEDDDQLSCIVTYRGRSRMTITAALRLGKRTLARTAVTSSARVKLRLRTHQRIRHGRYVLTLTPRHGRTQKIDLKL
jgi:hypothetical protein